MPRATSHKTRVRALESASHGSLEAILVNYALEQKISLIELARKSEISLATLRKWMDGHSSSDTLVSQAITKLGLQNQDFSVFKVVEDISIFDARSMERNTRIADSRHRFERIQSAVAAETRRAPEELGSLLDNRFVKRFGKQLFQAALVEGTYSGEFGVRLPDKGALLQAPWRQLYLHGMEDGQLNREGLSYLNLSKPAFDYDRGSTALGLSDLLQNYCKIEDGLRARLGDIQLEIITGPALGDWLKIIDLDWGNGWLNFSSIVDRAFAWLSDDPAQIFFFAIFEQIKVAMRAGERKILLYSHDGYFNDELVADDDENSDEEMQTEYGTTDTNEPELSLRDEISGLGVDPSTEIAGFNYGPRPEGEISDDDNDGYGQSRKIFLSCEGGVSREYVKAPVELSFNVIQLLFGINGYKFKAFPDRSSEYIHRIEISW